MFGTQAFPVTESIWCIRRRSYLTCSYIVRTNNGTVLIDAGMDSDGRDVQHGMSKMGLSLDSIHSILLTHWHDDHAAGASAIQSTTNASVFCHKNDSPSLTRKSARRGLRGWFADIIPEWGLFVLFKGVLGEATPRAIRDPHLTTDGDELFDDFTVIESAGHTPGHLCYYYKPEKTLFAGDALAVVDDRIRFMARPVTPDLKLARKSMAKCLSFDIDILCPGHRQPLTTDTPRKCREALENVNSNERWPFFG